MQSRLATTSQICFCVSLAFIFWGIVFGLKIVNFWLGLSIGACILAALSMYIVGKPFSYKDITCKSFLIGSISAAVLYSAFVLCKWFAVQIFSFAPDQISNVYSIRQQAPPAIIAFVLICITSPAEEIFWRGFLQRWSMERFGKIQGWLIATTLYAAVHIVSCNLMLVGAAFVAGLIWGYLYMKTNNLFICILSHAIWTVVIFILWPLG